MSSATSVPYEHSVQILSPVQRERERERMEWGVGSGVFGEYLIQYCDTNNCGPHCCYGSRGSYRDRTLSLKVPLGGCHAKS